MTYFHLRMIQEQPWEVEAKHASSEHETIIWAEAERMENIQPGEEKSQDGSCISLYFQAQV